MRIPIAAEGFMFILPAGLMAGLFWYIKMPCVASIFGVLFAFVTYFFRDPERIIPTDANVVVSPADGKVVEIVTEKDPILGKTFKRISIFLSVFNVHINRSPIEGKVEKIQYNPGKFLAAFNHKASLDNEQNTLLISNGKTQVLVKQIAGLIARRLVCWVRVEDKLELGQRFGLIRFGSRVDIFLPENTDIRVKLGDHVQGGNSVIGFLKGEA
ncbi:MAG: phosphatidylserine decarboxylase [Nitrospinae bacterium RIFCSPLOWO2_12_FULL_47_7]|nr:MAG: phosphatidylserine decarboxylase [Nitrospinae bacterium RIFCSPLOWO2_12_FULL_47_7]